MTRIVEITLEDEDKTVHLRPMSVAAADTLLQMQTQWQQENVPAGQRGMRVMAFCAAACLCNEAGERLFEHDEYWDAALALDMVEARQLGEVAMRISGLEDDGEEEPARGKLEAVRSG